MAEAARGRDGDGQAPTGSGRGRSGRRPRGTGALSAAFPGRLGVVSVAVAAAAVILTCVFGPTEKQRGDFAN